MASKRRLRRASCGTKVRYANAEEAANRGVFGRLHPYRCRFCNGWHVGRLDRRRLQSFRARKAAQ